jgi:hypothetical protein
VASTVCAALAACIVSGDSLAGDACTGTAGRMAGRATVAVPSAGHAEQPGGCRRAGSACRHSCQAAAVLATGTAGEARDSSLVGECALLLSLVGRGGRAVVRGLAGGRGCRH